jgi:hypothetical protein
MLSLLLLLIGLFLFVICIFAIGIFFRLNKAQYSFAIICFWIIVFLIL